jgi:hypothetical protein
VRTARRRRLGERRCLTGVSEGAEVLVAPGLCLTALCFAAGQ